jgi:hypothetical protein
MRHGWFVWAGAIAAITACGSSTSPQAANTQLVLVQAAPALGAVTLSVDGAALENGVSPDQVSSFGSIKPGSHTVTLVPATGAAETVAGTNQLLPLTGYDVLAVDSIGTESPQLLPDIVADTTPGVGHIRVVHAATSLAGDSLNFYLTPQGVPSDTALHDSATAFAAQIGFPLNPGYLAIAPGTYELRASVYEYPDTVLFRASGIVVTVGQSWTVVVADGASAGTHTAILVKDQN